MPTAIYRPTSSLHDGYASGASGFNRTEDRFYVGSTATVANFRAFGRLNHDPTSGEAPGRAQPIQSARLFFTQRQPRDVAQTILYSFENSANPVEPASAGDLDDRARTSDVSHNTGAPLVLDQV